MHDESTFGDRVMLLRRRMKLTQGEFAKLLRISRNYLSQIETGREPSEMLKAAIERLEVEYERQNSLSEDYRTPGGASLMTFDEPVYGARSKLRQLREEKGYSLAEFAKAVGYSISLYQDIENGRSNMGEKMILKAAPLLGISPAELMAGSDEPPVRGITEATMGTIPEVSLKLPPELAASGFSAPKKAKVVPLLSWAQCGTAGAPDDAGYGHEGWVVFDPADAKTFAVRARGDSMVPRIEPGDVAIIYPTHQPRNGNVVLAKTRDGDVMLKVYQGDRDKVTLSSYNPAHPPFTRPRSDFEWIYKVAQVSKSFE